MNKCRSVPTSLNQLVVGSIPTRPTIYRKQHKNPLEINERRNRAWRGRESNLHTAAYLSSYLSSELPADYFWLSAIDAFSDLRVRMTQ
jgi:hypothetical protein